MCSPLLLILLRVPQQLLDVLGDLLRLADDVLGGGQRRVSLTLKVTRFRDGSLSKPPTGSGNTGPEMER